MFDRLQEILLADHDVGETRTIKRFLFLPKKINGERRWLRYARIKQIVKVRPDMTPDISHDPKNPMMCWYWWNLEWDDNSSKPLNNKLVVKFKERSIRPPIVCLCGSTRFLDTFFEMGWKYTLEGWIVLSIGVSNIADDQGGHGAEAIGPDVADRLDELYLRKIDLADEIMILNVGGYIGESTLKELMYAQSIGKKIVFLENDPEPNNSVDTLGDKYEKLCGV